ncbi:MAG: alpha/beta hydrolase [Rhodospirillales bacterium]|nr:alpha/beta hydrolase [Rhodospirillales bacterium]
MRILTVVLAVVWTFLVPPAAFAAGPVGVILMHGKWGSPDYNIVQLADKLNAAGFLVERPLMPWSRKRDYDADYTQAMEEIDAVAERLRKRGATQIAVGGHSFGANVALGYAATRPDVAAILALAPGHVPELFASRLTESIAKARNLVEQGRGEETANFDDINQGKTKIITPKARVYLSYFDPDGPAVMPRNAAAIKKPTPFLWVIGTGDSLYQRGESYAYSKAPAHPASRYLVVEAQHVDTPDVAADKIVEWIKQAVGE